MKDIYAEITSKIVAAIEHNPDAVVMPWHRGGASGTPRNAYTQADYNGINVLNLWVCGMEYGHPVWASYNQWSMLGCQVRKGEKASPIIYYNTREKEQDGEVKNIPFIRSYSVFNADQVDGYQHPETAKMPPLERLTAVDAFVRKTGATVIEGGTVACYIPSQDIIKMPDAVRFFDTEQGTRTENYYSVLQHELVHWSGHASRLARKGGRFGDDDYAFEELVAELGAAFLCARLQITPAVREDHAAYCNNWLRALKSDKKFIFSAAAQAQLATEFLCKAE